MLPFVAAVLLSQAPQLNPDAGTAVAVLVSPAPELKADGGTAVAVLVSPAPELKADAGADLADDERKRQTVVTASRTERKLEDVVVPTEVVTRPQIEAIGARDLPQLLQQQPGVELVYTNRSVGVRLQGLDPEYTLVLVDGQRVAGRAGPATDVSRFSLRELERVEIVKGPSAAVYGADAMGGVINLITRHPTKPIEGAVRGMFGTAADTGQSLGKVLEGDVRGNVGSKLGAWELRAGGGYRTRDAFDWDKSDPATSVPAQKRFDGDLEVAWQPKPEQRVFARTEYVRMDMAGVDLNDTGAVFDRRQRTEQFDVWLGGQSAVWEGGSLSARGHYGLFRDQFQLDQRASRALDEYTQSLTRYYEAYAQVEQKLGTHLLSGGLEGISETLYSSRITPPRANRYRGALFVQDEWRLNNLGIAKVAILPGIRADLDSQFGAAPSPRLAAKVDVGPQVTFRAAWGLGFRPPTFSELYLFFANTGIGYVVQGNPKLTAEHSNSINLSVDYRPPIEGMVFSASAWHTSLSNLINVTADSPPNPDNPTTFNYENVADAYTQGIEVSGRVKLSRGTFLELGYMGLDARDVTRRRPLEGRAPHRVTGQLMWKYRPSGLEGVVRASWVAPRPYYLGQGGGAITNVLGYGDSTTVMAPAYVDLEIQVTYVFKGWLKFFVNGYNLLNNGDATFNPRPPRGLIGGATVEY